MATTRSPISQILLDFQHIYQRSILECANEYLATGNEQMNSFIGLRAQFIKPTPAEIKELSPLINELQEKENRTTRENVFLGTANEYGLCVKQNYQEAHDFYKIASTQENSAVAKKISDRDRGHALANLASLYASNVNGIKEDIAEYFKFAAHARDLGSELGAAHLGAVYTNLGRLDIACPVLCEASNTFFAQGRLAYLYKEEIKDLAKAEYYFEQAAKLGCPQSLFELRNFHKDDRNTEAALTYHASLILANIHPDTEGVPNEDIKTAKEAFQKVATDMPAFFEDQMDDSPWQRVESLLDKPTTTSLLNTKAVKLAQFYVSVQQYLLPDLRDLTMAYICMPEYIKQATEHTSWVGHITFWQTNSGASREQLAKHVGETVILPGENQLRLPRPTS